MSDDMTVWPIAMTKRGGILGDRRMRIPAYIPNRSNGTVIVAAATADGLNFTTHEYPCVTYYVNSQSNGTLFGPPETGSGTIEDPWVNLNSVFTSELFSCIIQNYCCLFVKIVITGTIDYYIDGKNRRFNNRLILDFQTALNINWEKKKHELSLEIVRNVHGVNFNNFAFAVTGDYAETESQAQVDIYIHCFVRCRRCIFYNHAGEIAMKNSISGTGARDHAALYVEYFRSCEQIQILDCTINIDLNSRSQETHSTDASVAHTRAAVVYDAQDALVIESHFTIKCVSHALDHSSGGDDFVAGIAQAFGLYRCRGVILSNTSITCSANATGGSYKASYIACALGAEAQYNNCTFSASQIQDNGDNRWTSSYEFVCYR